MIALQTLAETSSYIYIYTYYIIGKPPSVLLLFPPVGGTVHVQELRPTTGFQQDDNHFQTFDKYSAYLFSEFLPYMCFIIDYII